MILTNIVKNYRVRLKKLIENNEISNSLDELRKRMDHDARRFSRMRSFINKLKNALEKNDYSKLKQQLAQKIVEDILKAYPESKQSILTLNEFVEKNFQKFLLNFEKEFIAKLNDYDLKINWWSTDVIEGAYPKYLINKMIEVEVNDRNNTIRVNNENIKGIQLEATFSKIIRENKRLFEREFNSDSFLESLFEAYETIIKKNNLSIGETIPLLEVYQLIIIAKQPKGFFNNPSKANFIPYLKDEFSVDLSRLLIEKSVFTKKEFKLELAPARDPQNSLFLVLPNGEQVYRGMIRFKRG